MHLSCRADRPYDWGGQSSGCGGATCAFLSWDSGMGPCTFALGLLAPGCHVKREALEASAAYAFVSQPLHKSTGVSNHDWWAWDSAVASKPPRHDNRRQHGLRKQRSGLMVPGRFSASGVLALSAEGTGQVADLTSTTFASTCAWEPHLSGIASRSSAWLVARSERPSEPRWWRMSIHVAPSLPNGVGAPLRFASLWLVTQRFSL